DIELVERVQSMEKSIHRASKMIQQMMTFSRKDSTEMKSVELCSFIKEIHNVTEASVPENIDFQLDLGDKNEYWVKCDVTQMQQVLINLVSNSKGALKDAAHGKITFALDKQPPPLTLLSEHLEFDTDGDWYRISCHDNGCGIPNHAKNHVFEPFFTTKPVGEGTGLGMAMVFGAVQNHRGLVDINDAPEGGTVVSIWLPAKTEKGVQVESKAEVDIDGGGKTLLLVDDEEELRLVLSEILRGNGFKILHAYDGENAVQVYQDYINTVDLVLMDVVMPNKGGVMAAKEIRALNPDIPVIFQTGYGEQTQLDAAASIPNSGALQKPLQVSDLLKSIAKFLNI
ncbi:MAG: response regulator, partial [Ghiorsea sp.]